MPPAKTLKQAKAAFKARDETPITEREAKQLERALQLDRRAWALREREKTRADVTKKRLAQEKAQKDEERRLGTQRRRDRFGFKSSQFHLGAFFQKPGLNVAEGNAVVEGNQSEAVGEMELRDEQGEHAGLVAQHNAADDDEFEDEFEDSIDDESLLEALQSPESVRTIRPAEKSPSNTKSATTATAAATSMPPPPLPLHKTTTKLSVPVTVQAKVSAPAANPPSLEQEWHSFLSSSTQIARELSDTQEPSPPHRSNPPESTAAASAQEAPRTNSFSSAGSSSSSFDLTEDDLEKLDPTTPSVGAAKRDQERAWMPPPPLPLPLPGGLKQDSRQGPEKEKESDIRKDAPRPAPSAARMNEDFTMTELESFVDEDLELTQAC